MNPILWYTLIVLSLGYFSNLFGNIAGSWVTGTMKPCSLASAMYVGVLVLFQFLALGIAVLILIFFFFPLGWWSL